MKIRFLHTVRLTVGFKTPRLDPQKCEFLTPFSVCVCVLTITLRYQALPRRGRGEVEEHLRVKCVRAVNPTGESALAHISRSRVYSR
jgi:hypothetical protein